MSSYYGGKPGKSFIIVETFDSIASMTAKFALGPAYTDVAFDEYVIINTQHKHNPENGQIFRRGYDYNSDRKIMNYQLVQDDKKQNQKYEAVAISAFGAIYVGTIAGPAGRAPQLNLTTYENIAFNEITEDGQPKIVSLADLKLALYPDDQTILMKLNQEFPQGKDLYEENSLRPFYAVKIDINENRGDNHIVEYHYYCCDNTILNDKTVYSAGWYQVASAPSYGIGSYTLEDNNLAYGVTYGENIVEPDEIDGEPNPNKGQEHLNPDTYQDTIDWKYMTVVNENHEDATAFIGFKFPIPISEFEVTSVDPYYHRNDREDTTIFQNINLLDRVSTNTGDKVHPFYHKYNINIPKGIKGDCINNFRILETGADIANIDVPEVDEDNNLLFNENGSLKVRKYGITDEEKDDIEHSREVIVYDYTTYNRVAEGDTYTFYLGDYNIIDKLTFDEDGTLTFGYTHEDDTIFNNEKRVNWINNIQFNENGTVTVTMNNNNLDTIAEDCANGIITKEQLLTWINDIQFNEDGTVIIEMNNDNLDTDESDFEGLKMQKDHFIKWINEFNIASDGTVTIVPNNDDFKFNNKTSDADGKIVEDKLITWLNSMNIDEHGTITVTPNNNTFEFNGQLVPEGEQAITVKQLIKWIDKVELDSVSGHLTITFNHIEDGKPLIYEADLTWVKDIQLNDDGSLSYDYTDKEDKTTDPIVNWINALSFDNEGTVSIHMNNDNVLKDDNGESVDSITKEHFVKWIDEIRFDESGTFYLKMNNNKALLNGKPAKELELKNLIKWISEITLSPDDGNFKVKFNNNDNDYIQQLIWVKDIQLNDDGSLTYDYTTGKITSKDQKITWIENVTFNKDNGMLNITFNNGNISNIQTQLDYVTGVLTEGNYLYTTSIGGTKKEAGLVPCTIASEVKPNNFNTYANGSIWFKLEEK